MEQIVKDLETAKKNVKWLLEHTTGLVDLKGIKYWAEVVEQKREELRKI